MRGCSSPCPSEYSDQSLITNLQAVVGFGTAFSFGWVLHRQIDLIRLLERRWLLNFTAAIVLIAASLALAGFPPR
jgi:glucan biosynthesis protein C